MKKNLFTLCLVFNSIAFYAQENEVSVEDLKENLLLHYKFDGNVDDVSGNDYDGVSYGEIEYTFDRFGVENNALSFDGIDDFVEFPNLSSLKPNLPISISFDIKYESDDVTERVVFNTSYKEDYNSGVFFTSQSSTGKYSVGYGDGSYNYSSNSRRSFLGDSVIEKDVWHYLTIVVNSSLDMKLYVDGINVLGSYSGTGGVLSYSDTPGVIGKHDQSVLLGAYFFKGIINDFKYWDKALSEEEVELLYESYLEEETLSVDDGIADLNNKEIVIKVKDYKLSIKSDSQVTNVEIFNMLGEKLYSGSSHSDIDMRVFDKEILIIKVQNDIGQFKIQKIAN